MPVLNTANGYYLGSNPVDKIYLGSNLVYNPVSTVTVQEAISQNYALSGTAGTVTISGITPVSGDVYYIIGIFPNNSGQPAVGTPTGWGTWNQSTKAVYAARRILGAWWMVSDGTPGNISINVSGTEIQDASIKMLRFSNVSGTVNNYARFNYDTPTNTATNPGIGGGSIAGTAGDVGISVLAQETYDATTAVDAEFSIFGSPLQSTNGRALYVGTTTSTGNLDTAPNWSWTNQCFAACFYQHIHMA